MQNTEMENIEMGDDPPVSIIIPTFNRGWILQDAIESVRSQDYPAVELIVVDDGSTDCTPEILTRYRDVVVTLRQENKGVSAARNAGIRLASGHLISFLDSDDVWLPKKLSVQVDFFKAHPDALICQTEEIWIRKGIRVNPKNRHKKLSGLIFEPSLKLCLVSPSAVMLRRSLLDNIGLFDESLPACEDYDLWLRVSSEYPVYLIPEPLIIKRGGHDDQLSKAPGLDRYRIQSIDKLLQSGRLTEVQKKAAVAVLKEKCAVYAGGCIKRGKAEEAMFYTTLSEKYS